MRTFKITSFLLFIVLLAACMENPKTIQNKDELTDKNEIKRQLNVDSIQCYKDSFIHQVSIQSVTTFDTLLNKHFDYQAAHLVPIEKSMVDAGLVDVLDVLPTVKIDLRYATTDNFVGEVLYPSVTRCFLRIETIIQLLKAYKYLHQLEPQYTFIIFDGGRPQSVQYKMYEIAKFRGQAKYVASPERGSLHNFGAAIDLSLYDIVQQKEVDMGTIYDFFGPEAQPRYHKLMLEQGKLTQNQVNNRDLLKKVMKEGGFHAIQTEWWHFESYDKNFIRASFSMIK